MSVSPNADLVATETARELIITPRHEDGRLSVRRRCSSYLISTGCRPTHVTHAHTLRILVEFILTRHLRDTTYITVICRSFLKTLGVVALCNEQWLVGLRWSRSTKLLYTGSGYYLDGWLSGIQ